MAKKTINDFYAMKQAGEQITFITCYDHPSAQVVDAVGMDMILVGDSLGMVVYGYDSTLPVTMDQMIRHTEAVRRGAPNTFIIGDMPFLSYQRSDEHAVDCAGRFYQEAAVDMVKLEGGRRITSRTSAIVNAGMLVMGHIGLTPQSSSQIGGFKAQGRTAESAKALVDDALALQDAGAAAVLLEAIPAQVSEVIHDRLSIPTLGIGAGPGLDGQLLIIADVLGLFQTFTPKFVKKYEALADRMNEALKSYIDDVKSGVFPQKEHCYPMKQEEVDRLHAML